MWHRFFSREQESGETAAVDSLDDEGYLETIPEVESIQSKRSSVVAGLPEMPFRALAPMVDRDHARRNRQSVVSSIYSQPDLDQDDYHQLGSKSVPGAGDISPLSTPRSSINIANSDQSVISPVEPVFTIPPAAAPQPEQKFKSQIPIPKIVHPSAAPKPFKDPRRKEAESVRWDTYSGEPTWTEAGKPSTVKPGQSPIEVQQPQLKERTKLILAGLRERDPELIRRKSPWGRPPPPVETDTSADAAQDEPRRATAARASLIEIGKPASATRKGPMQYPQRNISRMSVEDHTRSGSPDSMGSAEIFTREPTPEPTPTSKLISSLTTIQPGTSALPRSIMDRKRGESPDTAQQTTERSNVPHRKPVPDLSLKMAPSQESIKPVVPLKIHNSRVVSPTAVGNLSMLQSPFHSPRQAEQGRSKAPSPLRVTASQPDLHAVQDYEQGLSPTPPATPPLHGPVSNNTRSARNLSAPVMEHEQSRFSWTTYTTTVADSPRSLLPIDAEDNPVPPLPSLNSSIMARRRPVTASPVPINTLAYNGIRSRESGDALIYRKPVNNERMRSASAGGMGVKSLPPTPVEMQANDKISSFEARMGDLASRKRNNIKITRELAERLKKNAINYDSKKRKEIEKMIVVLGFEHDEITREEHDIGLLLHRAQKKRDRDDNYENPTGLWIKRVTS